MKNLKRLLAALLVMCCIVGPAAPGAAAHAYTVSSAVTMERYASKKSDPNVWIAPAHGKKYHKSKNCRTLRRSKTKKLKLSKAKKKGYKSPCKVCC